MIAREPDPIARLTLLFARLPGVGEKTAQRLAFHVLKSPPDYARDLAAALLALQAEVRLCSRCCNLTAQDPCGICRDTRRMIESRKIRRPIRAAGDARSSRDRRDGASGRHPSDRVVHRIGHVDRAVQIKRHAGR